MPDAQLDQELQGLVKEMLVAGKSDDEVTKFVQQYDDISHPIRAVIGGAVEGIPSGLVKGIMALPTGFRDTVLDTIDVMHGQTPQNAKAFVDGLGEWLPAFQAAGLREKSKMLSELVTSAGAGVATGYGTAKMFKPGVKLVGEGLEAAGDRPFISHIGGAASVGAGIWRGDPELIGAGLAAQMAPPFLSKAGKSMIRFGGGIPESDLKELRTVAKTERLAWKAQDAERAVAEKGMRSELGAATSELDNETQLAAIRKAREGLNPQDPTFSRSVSAKGPNGTESMSERFTPVEEPTGPELMIGGQKVSSMNPDLAAKIRVAVGAQEAQTPLVSGGPVRPTIRITPSPSATVTTIPETAPLVSGGPERPTIQVQPPKNLHMGSQAPIDDIVKDVRQQVTRADERIGGIEPTEVSTVNPSNIDTTVEPADLKSRVMGGGIRIDGRNPIQLKPGTEVLTEEAQKVFDQYVKDNPKANKATVLATLRKLTGQ